MNVDELLAEVVALLQREGRVSYRMLKRRLGRDDAYLEDLKAELIVAKRLASDEDGKVLVWTGHSATPQTPDSGPQTSDSSTPPPPASYTPKHLAERIRAEQAAMAARGLPRPCQL